MPRPGPRPFECVRRAWHSDRHQPIRGSLIQELFRIVNVVHSSATRKNKEWQEKLPVVVLKAEEIMYSKANSEAEYVDFNTLWDRANEAIDTIIRRDETETGELLQPCIEAALHLGCTPRRASRSQRNITPRCYLNPGKPEIPPVSLSNLETQVPGTCPSSNHPLIPQSSKLLAANLMRYSQNLDVPVSSSCSVYPLYYGNHQTSVPLAGKADKEDVIEKHSSCGQDGSNVVPLTPPESGCDLSLRLGPLEVSCLDIESRWPPEETAVGALGACEVGIKPNDDESLQCDKTEFSFFPKAMARARAMLDCSSSPVNRVPEALLQDPNAEQSLRKRKAAAEDRQFGWPLKIPFKQLNGRVNNVD